MWAGAPRDGSAGDSRPLTAATYAYSPEFAGEPGYGGAGPYARAAGGAPQPVEKPLVEVGWRDKGYGFLFWVHFAAVAAVAFLYGVPAVRRDAGSPEDDPDRPALDLNASLFLRVIMMACGVGAAMSAVMLFVLSRAAGGLIKCALYTSLVLQAALTAAMFTVSVVVGAIMVIPLLLTAWYVRAVQRRIPFATAHVEAAVAAVRAHSGVFAVAVVTLFLQAAWVGVWATAALGLEDLVNTGGSSSSSSSSRPSSSSTRGGIVVFAMLVSLLWGVQLLKYVAHFVVASVTGHWWFIASPSAPVRGSLWRAFTSSFGTLSLAALVLAVLETSKRAARAAMNRSERRGNSALAILACLAVCILGCVEALVAYLNVWGIIYAALTGHAFAQAGREAWELFKSRGWTAVINDDLVGDALRIAGVMVGAGSAVVGGGLTYLAIPHSPFRTEVAGMAAALCAFVGFAMADVMLGVLSSAVRTVFVCFAMNPGALAGTHPDHLARLVAAWHAFHPTVFVECGYAAAYPAPAPTAVVYATPPAL